MKSSHALIIVGLVLGIVATLAYLYFTKSKQPTVTVGQAQSVNSSTVPGSGQALEFNPQLASLPAGGSGTVEQQNEQNALQQALAQSGYVAPVPMYSQQQPQPGVVTVQPGVVTVQQPQPTYASLMSEDVTIPRGGYGLPPSISYVLPPPPPAPVKAGGGGSGVKAT